MKIDTIEAQGKKITFPESLSPARPDDASWVDEVGDFWLEEMKSWQRDFDSICRWGDSIGPPQSGDRWRRRLQFLRSQLRNLGCENRFSPVRHEDMFNRDRRHYSRNAVTRAVYFGAALMTIFVSVLCVLFPSRVALLAVVWSATMAVIAAINWYATGNQPRRHLRVVSSLAGMLVTGLLWALPTLLGSWELERAASGCLILLTFFMAAVLDLGRRTMAGYSVFATALVIVEPWVRGTHMEVAWSQAHVYRILLMIFTGLIAVLTSYRRSRARRIIFALEQQTNALLFYCHTREASTLPEPEELTHSVVNSS